jgi:hypothetical protein
MFENPKVQIKDDKIVMEFSFAMSNRQMQESLNKKVLWYLQSNSSSFLTKLSEKAFDRYVNSEGSENFIKQRIKAEIKDYIHQYIQKIPIKDFIDRRLHEMREE